MHIDTHWTSRILVVMALLLAGLTVPAMAQVTFTVDSTGDEADATDDSFCETASGDCTLRAALGQAASITANSTDAVEIRFDGLTPVNGMILIQPNSELPDVASDVSVLGQTADGYTSGEAPVVYVDGTNLTAMNHDGLEVGGNGYVRAIGVVNVPDDGINLISVDGATVEACWVGVMPDGTAAPNGRNSSDGAAGIEVFSGVNWSIGRTSRFNSGRANVIAGNQGHGIDVESAGSGDVNAEIGENYIGILPDNTVRGNDGYGIYLDNVNVVTVGFVDGSTRLGNVISGNAMGGIFSYGHEHTIQANFLGAGVDGTSKGTQYAPGPVGITLVDGEFAVSEDNSIQRNSTVGGDNLTDGTGNFIGNYAVGLQHGANVDGSDIAASNHPVRGNFFGVTPSGQDIGLLDAGVVSTLTDSLDVAYNVFGFIGDGEATDAAIYTSGTDIHFLRDNFIGMTDQSFDAPIDGKGYLLESAGESFLDITVDSESDTDSRIPYVGNTSSDAIYSDGIRDLFIRNVRIGIKPNGDPAAVGGSGVYYVAGTAGDVLESLISNTSGDGVSVVGTDATLRVSEVRFTNIGAGPNDIPIDLGDDGPTPNDTGSDADADTGPNDLQNHPEITQVVSCTPGVSSDDVTIEYRVETRPTNASFPLTVQFFVSANSSEPGGSFLGEDTYQDTDAPFGKQVTFSGSNLCDRYVSATARDQNLNTSEYSPMPAQLPVELADFEAVPDGETAVLTWSTLSETGNDRFVIEHQAPGVDDFSDVGTVEGAGTTSKTTRYQFATSALDPGTHRFRLRQIDVDGDEHLSEPVSAQIDLDGALVLTAPAPHPVRDRLTVKVGVREAGQTARIVLYDLLGRPVATVYEGTPRAGELTEVERALPPLPSGRYFLRLEAGGRTAVQSLTIVR